MARDPKEWRLEGVLGESRRPPGRRAEGPVGRQGGAIGQGTRVEGVFGVGRGRPGEREGSSGGALMGSRAP